MLELIEVYLVVVREGSFTRAAARLDTSRSVVSKKISDLEQTLAVRLLNRTTRRLSLTEAGERFFERCRGGLSEIEDAAKEVTSMSREPRGRLHLNLPMSFGISRIAPLMAEFLALYPGIQADLNFDDRKVELVEPGFDLSIRVADLDDSSFAARRLCACQHRVVAAPAYLGAHASPHLPDNLGHGHRIASFRHQDSALEWRFEKGGQMSSVKLAAAIVADNSLALKAMVLAGAAIARMPTFLVAEELAQGQLVALLPEFKCPTKAVYALFPQRRYLPGKTRVFIDFLAGKISDPAPWDQLCAHLLPA